MNCLWLILEIFGHLILYTSIVLYILTLLTDIKLPTPSQMGIIMFVLYFIYVIGQFVSSTFQFLRNKINKDKLKSIFEILIKTPPTIEIFLEEYKDINEKLKYHCSRDISGYIDLDIPEEKLKGKNFVALAINPEIYLVDEISLLDYAIFKGLFYDINNKHIFKKKSVEEKRYISEDFNNFFLIYTGEKCSCSINVIFFIIFTIIPVAIFYKIYIYHFFYEKEISIRKIISVREDLNQEKYDIYNPYIKSFGQIYDYEKNDILHYGASHFVFSSENDNQFSSKYKEYLPQFEIEKYIDIDDHRKIGIIKGVQSSYIGNAIHVFDAYEDLKKYLEINNINIDDLQKLKNENFVIIYNNENPQNDNKNNIEDEKKDNIMQQTEENRINMYAIKTDE